MHQPAAESFLTPSDVLARLRVNVKTLYRPIGVGELPAARVGRQWRVRPHGLEIWLRDHQDGADLGPEHASGTPGDALEGNHARHPIIEWALLQEGCL